MRVFPLLKSMSKQRRGVYIESILEANKYSPEFSERFRYTNQFLMKTGPKVSPDEFSYEPTGNQKVAVGFRIHPQTFIAEHAVWQVDDELKLLGTTVCEPIDNHGYFGVVIDMDFYKTHGGPLSYNLVLGNLRLLQKMGFKNYYA